MNFSLKRSLLFFVCLLFFSFSYIPHAFSYPRVKIFYEYYDIFGTTESELRQEMDSKGILFKDQRYDAFTDWQVKWNYKYARAKTGCSIGTVIVSVAIIYKFPRWKNHDAANQDLLFKWYNYISALKVHEKGHATIAKEVAEEIETTLLKIGEKNNCESCRVEANAKANSILDKYKEKEALYDTSTSHGKTQGTNFP